MAVFKDSLLGFSLAISLGGELPIREGDVLSKPTGDTEGDMLVNATGDTEGTELGAGIGFSVGLFVGLERLGSSIAFDSVAGDVVGGVVLLPSVGAGTLMLREDVGPAVLMVSFSVVFTLGTN